MQYYYTQQAIEIFILLLRFHQRIIVVANVYFLKNTQIIQITKANQDRVKKET